MFDWLRAQQRRWQKMVAAAREQWDEARERDVLLERWRRLHNEENSSLRHDVDLSANDILRAEIRDMSYKPPPKPKPESKLVALHGYWLDSEEVDLDQIKKANPTGAIVFKPGVLSTLRPGQDALALDCSIKRVFACGIHSHTDAKPILWNPMHLDTFIHLNRYMAEQPVFFGADLGAEFFLWKLTAAKMIDAASVGACFGKTARAMVGGASGTCVMLQLLSRKEVKDV